MGLSYKVAFWGGTYRGGKEGARPVISFFGKLGHRKFLIPHFTVSPLLLGGEESEEQKECPCYHSPLPLLFVPVFATPLQLVMGWPLFSNSLA